MTICALANRNGTLRVRPERQACHPGDRGLLLDSAVVGDYGNCRIDQGVHFDISMGQGDSRQYGQGSRVAFLAREPNRDDLDSTPDKARHPLMRILN